MNIGFIGGNIKNEIKLEFIYNTKEKSISRKHTSIVKLIIEKDNNIIYARAYDDVADYIYRNLKKWDVVMLYGKVRSNYFEIFGTFSHFFT